MKPRQFTKRTVREVPKLLKTNFSLQVAKRIIQENIPKSKNIVCSPASIDAFLRILALGADNSTLDQFLKLLGHANVRELNEAAFKLANALKGSDNKDDPEISYVNALWLDQRFSLKSEFEKVLRDVHNAQARTVDFVNQGDKVAEEVNAWANQETKGLIKHLLTRDDIREDTKLVLANALYFKGTWEKSFQSYNTQVDVFNLLDGHKVRVPFMNLWSEEFYYGTFKGCQVLRMPYKTESSLNYSHDSMMAAYKTGKPFGYCNAPTRTFSMYIFLPYEKDGLPHFMKDINISENMFKDQVKLANVKVARLSIPKFKFESQLFLQGMLGQLGVPRKFSEIINNNEPFYVSSIVQKCCVETDEKGTEAAAVTYCCVEYGSMVPSRRSLPEINFVADHPFMFMIKEYVSGAILFVGTMLDPR